jgi:hypothetical protein
MDAKEIRIEFIRKDINQAMVARKLGVSSSLVSRVIDRKVVSRPASIGIADAIERPLEEVFPELSECSERRRSACN